MQAPPRLSSLRPRAKPRVPGRRPRLFATKAREAHGELDRTRDAIAAAEHEAQSNSKQLGALAEAIARTRAALDEARQQGERIRDRLAWSCPALCPRSFT